MKRVLAVVSALVLLGLTGFFASGAEASKLCPAPGAGSAGALNMMHDATMWQIPMVHNTTQNTNGNDGMFHAVEVSRCP
jgi:hypothetical protein